jgi:Glutathione-dependent formaldehyde-activating enzyme
MRNIDFMDVVVRTGGCLCGAVRYTVRGEPVHVGRCHCADCRKESGSAFTVYAQWPIEACEVTGDICSYDGRGFCPRGARAGRVGVRVRSRARVRVKFRLVRQLTAG